MIKLTKINVCTCPPWKQLIPFDIRTDTLRKIRQECIDAYGYDLDRCPKSKVCFTKSCMGRPLPWKSQTALPYLQQLEQLFKIEVNSETKEREIVINTDCSKCQQYKTCHKTCPQIEDFLERDYSKEPVLDFRDTIEGIAPITVKFEAANFKVTDSDLAWDVLTKKRKAIIKKYLFEERNYKDVAEIFDLVNQAHSKVEFYSALTKLAKYSIIRKFIKEEGKKLTEQQQLILKEVYFKRKSYKEVGNALGITKQAIHLIIKKVFKKYKVKYPKFVKRVKGKVIYQVPQVFK